MQTCIICRKEKTHFNDEHVIPDSIEGYYHIKSVCSDCNARMGHTIDNKLTNHKFIEFQRHLFKIRGKSGQIPNPFSGTLALKDNPDQKLHLVAAEEGKLKPRLLTNLKTRRTDGAISSFSLTIDKKDIKEKDKIIEKILVRNGIPKERIKMTEEHKSHKPWIEVKMVIDIRDFKLSLLKIAYEFAVDHIPEYFSDPKAKVISEILSRADFKAFDKQIKFIGDGFDKQIIEPFSHLIDFENRNHYLIIISDSEQGLICLINLYNIFTIGVLLSEKGDYLSEQDAIIIGKNDIELKKFNVYKTIDLIRNVYTPIEYRFQYFLPNLESVKEFMENERDKDFDFFRLNNKVPFFNASGEIKYSSIDEKIDQDSLAKVDRGDMINSIVTDIILDEELYVKLLPNKKLYRVISVGLEQHKRGKI